MSVETYSNYSLQIVFGRVNQELAREIADFWLKNNAITNPLEAGRRTSEVVMVIRNEQDEVAAVSTAYLDKLPDSDDLYHFFRMFIRAADRVPGLARQAVLNSIEYLASQADATAKPKGLVMVTENRKLAAKIIVSNLKRMGFVHLGTDQGGNHQNMPKYARHTKAPAACIPRRSKGFPVRLLDLPGAEMGESR